MNDTLNQLIAQYRDAKRHLVAVQDADQATFDAALAACRNLRGQINAACPDGEYDPNIDNVVERI